ncbi:phosphonopyruvate decarboxylase-related protein [Pyrolobus fumarii 1A]|uniref:Phosphonopyruvate decarboxylase-related protein n=1 Tax=Pyrolobus fumarii (strain DSM 11204 / 1A) TaxID=694429 RepID=G0EHP6_PYRF1|nr:alkaline phosphatase family protein [Pyrolobus fumarii]AEM39399.1 phosphonopyruvate decarboxylase-related protein [Pyrolobus fumarii 1A]
MKPEKLIFLVLDGVADSITQHEPTALEAAEKPALDSLAKHAVYGLVYPVAPGVAPESDVAVLSLLGYEPEKYYTGRGPLEALGAGLEIKEGYEVAFRGNFATIDESTLKIIDRRVGRSLTSEEARKLAESLDGMELSGGGYARVRATVGHRVVVIIGSKVNRLSDQVENIDPAYVRKGLVSVAVPNPDMRLRKCKPLVDAPEARETCRLVDEFVARAIEVLSKHPINVERERKGLLKANAVILRDAGGRLPRMPKLQDIYGRKFAAVVEMPVERGIAKAAGMKIVEVNPPSGDLRRDLPERLDATLRGLEEADVVYVHLKGPDEPGHDGDFERKKKAVELIDELFVAPLLEKVDLERVAILVTADHATPWPLKSHSGDPVPFILSWKGFSGGPGVFNERACKNGIKLEHGWQLLPFTVEKLGWK